MDFEHGDPNERFRARRLQARRRQIRRRRLVATGALLLAGGAVAVGWRATNDGSEDRAAVAARAPDTLAARPTRIALGPRPAPFEIRGVHMTMSLASVPGKLDEFLTFPGLNTLELDVKDENGHVGFVAPAVPLARAIGAARPYYRPQKVVARARRHGVYLIGRVVCFEDPVLSAKRPSLAIKRADGSVWRNRAGLGWTSPYDRRVWDYNVAVAAAAARAGFDEIQFDYVRFPSDGDVSAAVYPGRTKTPPGWVIAQFVHYAAKRLEPLGVRVSADLFGLAATRDLGIGQVPARLAKYLDAVYPMVYPSHYGAGEYGLRDPSSYPAETVARSLADFALQLEGADVDVVPWLQDFTLGRAYTIEDVKAQIDAARAAGTRGFMLWNAGGSYTTEVLRYEPEAESP